MSAKVSANRKQHFGQVSHPRVERTKLQLLLDIIGLSICAVICGADSWVEVEQFGHQKEEWLRTFLELPHSIPSHDTIGDLFARLDPDAFEQGFLAWVQALAVLTEAEIIAIEAKRRRRSHDHRLSAWVSTNHLVLAQVKVNQKSNEITAIPERLNVLALPGCIVTIDAMGCQSEIAERIVAKAADSMLALKGHHAHLLEDLTDIFQTAQMAQFKDRLYDQTQMAEKRHGRVEIRRCWTITDPAERRYLPDLKA
jgi:predicted transposase YbfD/YdcC